MQGKCVICKRKLTNDENVVAAMGDKCEDDFLAHGGKKINGLPFDEERKDIILRINPVSHKPQTNVRQLDGMHSYTWDNSRGDHDLSMAIMNLFVLEDETEKADYVVSPKLSLNKTAILLAGWFKHDFLDPILYNGALIKGDDIREWLTRNKPKMKKYLPKSADANKN